MSHVESLIPKESGSSVKENPGARSLLQSLIDANAPWIIVTSCTRTLLDSWREFLSLPVPSASVAAEDVDAGKPDPACYMLGRKRINVDNQARVLVIEDAPSGVAAGKAAGCAVLGLTTTTGPEKLRSAGADWIIKDLSSVRLIGQVADGYEISFSDVYRGEKAMS